MAKSLSGQNFVPSKPKRHVKVMDHIPNRPMDERSIVARENVNPLSNVQTSHCGGVAVSAAALASPAQADWYVNPELNVGVGLDSGVGSGILEGHVGYDFDNGAYVQAGPAVIFPDAGEKEVEFTGKAGISGGPLYGEVSFGTGDELGLSFKTGAKFSF